MLYSLLAPEVAGWFGHDDCPARQIVAHMEKAGRLRDAQIEAIKTYLFLKIAGGNRPLHELFCDGFFVPNEDLGRLHINQEAHAVFERDRAARALFEFSRTKAGTGQRRFCPKWKGTSKTTRGRWTAGRSSGNCFTEWSTRIIFSVCRWGRAKRS
jgi:hypothetical protein